MESRLKNKTTPYRRSLPWRRHHAVALVSGAFALGVGTAFVLHARRPPERPGAIEVASTLRSRLVVNLVRTFPRAEVDLQREAAILASRSGDVGLLKDLLRQAGATDFSRALQLITVLPPSSHAEATLIVLEGYARTDPAGAVAWAAAHAPTALFRAETLRPLAAAGGLLKALPVLAAVPSNTRGAAARTLGEVWAEVAPLDAVQWIQSTDVTMRRYALEGVARGYAKIAGVEALLWAQTTFADQRDRREALAWISSAVSHSTPDAVRSFLTGSVNDGTMDDAIVAYLDVNAVTRQDEAASLLERVTPARRDVAVAGTISKVKAANPLLALHLCALLENQRLRDYLIPRQFIEAAVRDPVAARSFLSSTSLISAERRDELLRNLGKAERQ